MATSRIHLMPRTPADDALWRLDPAYAEPEVLPILQAPENAHLLAYVMRDPFGSHVFPGETSCPPGTFFEDVGRELTAGGPYFLWCTIPLCKYHCRFCQFPIVVQRRNHEEEQAVQWVRANIAEAKLWLENVPNLRCARVGEFCLFGGTPTLLPNEQLGELLDFYRSNFGFDETTTMRIEGSPDSLSREKLAFLHARGCRKITYGIQSFDDELVNLAGRLHTSEQAIDVLRNARDIGFERIDGDLIYGLLDQTVGGFGNDVAHMLRLGFSTVVVTKLHLRPFAETNTAIAGVTAPWQRAAFREKLTREGHRWPSLGEQYQMRETAAAMLEQAGMHEYPTMYFQNNQVGGGRWKSLVLDQDKQSVEIGIGFGASSSSSRSSANITVDRARYFDAISAGTLPLDALQMGRHSQIASSIRRALSTCQPLSDAWHRRRCFDSSLFDDYWLPRFESLERRHLVRVDHQAREIALTPPGKTLVEAIMNTEIR